MAESKAQSEKNDRLLAAIEAFAEIAYGSSNTDELAQSRTLSIQRYVGANIDPAPEGRSQVRDRTVFETVEWIKPSLLRIYAGSDEVVKFDPQGPEDEALAEQESFYTNYAVTQKNNWHQLCHDWFSDALLLKNGYMYVCWDEAKVVESELYENQSDDSFAFIMQDAELEVTEHSERINEPLAQAQDEQFQRAMQQWQMMAADASMQGGQPPPPPQQPPPPKLHDFRVKRINRKGQVKLSVMAPERCLIDIETESTDISDCNYFEWFDIKSIGQLRADGLDVPDDANDELIRPDASNLEEDARDLYTESYGEYTSRGQFNDPSMRRVRVRYIWVRHDYDGDGINELQYVVVIGRNILFREECDEIPVASISPIPMAHRHIGMSIADTVADIEDINSAFIRQGIDNLFFATNPRLVVSDRVNMADLLDSRPGGVVRVEGQPPQEVLPLVVPDMFPNAINAVSFFDQRRQNRTGINAYFQGTDGNALNKTASGISQLTNSAAQRVEMIARLFAPGVMRIFSLAHKLIMKHGHKDEIVRMRGKWVPIDPGEWRKRNDIRVVVGLGTGSKEGLTAQLTNIFGAQLQAAQFGVVRPENVYHTLKELAKSASFATPEKFATDPIANPPPPSGPPLEVQLKQMDQQMEQAKTQQASADKERQLQFQEWQTTFEGDLTRWKEQLSANLELSLAGIKDNTTKEIEGGRNQLEMARIASSEKPAVQVDGAKYFEDGAAEIKEMFAASMTQMQAAIAAMSDAVSALVTVSSAPKEVIYDKNGRVLGTRPRVQ